MPIAQSPKTHVALKGPKPIYKGSFALCLSARLICNTLRLAHSPPQSIVQSATMPLVQTQPQGRTVRLANIFFHRRAAHAKNKTRTFVEGYHFGPLWGRRKVVQFDTDVPVNESSSNLRYVDMRGSYSRTWTALSVHESRVHIGRDMFLVSGYWDPKADINRSIFAAMKIIWRGELSVVHAGRYIPYYKRIKDGHKADLAVKRCANSSLIPSISTLMMSKRFAEVFKHRRTVRRFVPKTILQH